MVRDIEKRFIIMQKDFEKRIKESRKEIQSNLTEAQQNLVKNIANQSIGGVERSLVGRLDETDATCSLTKDRVLLLEEGLKESRDLESDLSKKFHRIEIRFKDSEDMFAVCLRK